MAGAPDDGLRLLEDPTLSSALDGYHLYHAVRADLLRRAGFAMDAAAAYRRAIDLVTNAVEREYLERRLSEVENP
jgi:RNA polymerase sigma-70 factor (ECF subfamily)